MANLTKKLGKNLKNIRLSKNMSQGDISRITGMDRAYVSRVENGQKNPTLLNLEKIANALEVHVDELIK